MPNQREKLIDPCPSIRNAIYFFETLSGKTATYMPAGPVPLHLESCYVATGATYMPASLV